MFFVLSALYYTSLLFY